MRIYLEFREGTSSKFWEVCADGTTVTTRWGRIGANGQSKTQTCASAKAARELANELAAEKQKKGYARTDAAPAGGKAAPTSSKPAPTSSKPAPTSKAVDTASATPGPSSPAESTLTDLTKLRRAMAAMNQGKVVALANAGPTQSGGYEDAAEEIARRGGEFEDYEIIFWHNQSHQTAFHEGALVGDLYLHWSGDLEAFARRLCDALGPEFEVLVPPNDNHAFRVRRANVPDDLDPTDTAAALAFMARLLGEERSEQVRPQLRRILRDGEPRAAMFALYLMDELADTTDAELALSRVDEIAELRAGPQSWQRPSYALRNLLRILERVGHPRHAELRESWKNHRRRVYRDALTV